jgi:thiol-disulfide isomerase/thioredoxin
MKLVSQSLSSKNLYGGFLHVIVVVLAVEVVILSRQNREFKEREDRSQRESVKPGDTLSFLGISALDQVTRLDSSSRKRVIFVFSTKCPFCKETFPFWNKLARETGESKVIDYLGICLDGAEETRAYSDEHKPEFPVFIATNKESYVKANRLYGVPQTIIASADGRVEKVWKGRLKEDDLHDLSKAVLDSASIQQIHTILKGGTK